MHIQQSWNVLRWHLLQHSVKHSHTLSILPQFACMSTSYNICISSHYALMDVHVPFQSSNFLTIMENVEFGFTPTKWFWHTWHPWDDLSKTLCQIFHLWGLCFHVHPGSNSCLVCTYRFCIHGQLEIRCICFEILHTRQPIFIFLHTRAVTNAVYMLLDQYTFLPTIFIHAHFIWVQSLLRSLFSFEMVKMVGKWERNWTCCRNDRDEKIGIFLSCQKTN